MPHNLSNEQKEVIKSSINHLIDLPAEEKLLSYEISLLKQALEEAPLEKDHKYAQLQACYFHPMACFNRLEELKPDITLGEVKEFILNFIIERVKKASDKAGVALTDLEWNPLIYLEKLYYSENLETYDALFRSQASNFDSGDHPWQIPADEAKIYSVEFIQDSYLRMIKVQINIHLPGWQPLEGGSIIYPPDIQTDAQEDAFIQEQQSAATQEAEQLVVEAVINHFIFIRAITEEQSRVLSDGAKKLLTYRFYFDAISQHTLPIEGLLYLSIKQANNLSKPQIIELIRRGKFALKTAKNFSQQELAFIQNPFYFQKIIHGRVVLKHFKGLTKKQAHIYNLPGVIYLQKIGEISFFDIKTIILEAAPIFESEFGIRLIKENKLPLYFAKRLKNNQARLLGNPFYAGEFSNDRLSLMEVKRLTSGEIRNLLLPSMIRLQKANKISRNDAKSASPDVCEVVSDAFYLELILRDELLYIDIHEINPEQVEVLLHPTIKQLLEMGALKISEALQLSRSEKNILVNESILKLYVAKQLALSELRKIPLGFVNLLDTSKCLYELLRQDVVTVTECLETVEKGDHFSNPLTQWGLYFGGRLIGLFKSSPYQNGEEDDNIRSIKKDLEAVALPNGHYTKKELINQAIQVFYRYLRQELIRERRRNNQSDSPYTLFLTELFSIETNNFEEKEQPRKNDCAFLLNRIANIARQKSFIFASNPELCFGNRARMSFSLFTPILRNDDIERIQTFHNRLRIITSFVSAYEAREEAKPLSLGMST